MTRVKRFESDWTKDQLERATKRFKKVVTIPIDTQIKNEHLVLNFNEARRILESAQKIALMDCTCRKQRGNCDAPLRTCLRLNERAVQAIEIEGLKHLNPMEVSVDEAIEVLEASYKSGLIHLAIAVDNKEINEVCSCCECCCMVLSAIYRYGLTPQLLSSKTIAYTDVQKCILCGTCIERCRLNARNIVDVSLIIDQNLCIGCGLCVSTCPTEAIKLKTRIAN